MPTRPQNEDWSSVGLSRRNLLQSASSGAMTLAGGSVLAATRTDARAAGRPMPKKKDEPEPRLRPEQRVRWAVVGLGKLALDQVLPAFGTCKKSRLVALVSGDRQKAEQAAQQYGVNASDLYTYDNYDDIAGNKDIDVVYVILPNSLHAEYSVRASNAGKHVLCEKPMAVSHEQCEQMIQAAEKAGKKLMIAYRCQYEPCNLAAVNLIRCGEIGDVRVVVTDNGRSADPSDPADEWRLQKTLAGGGALLDVGIYGVNGARYLTGEEPVLISAMTHSPADDPRFKEVEDVVTWEMRFPSGAIAHGSTGYSYAATSRFNVLGTKGVLTLDPATSYYEHSLRVKTGQGEREIEIHERNQFALEMDDFSAAILKNRGVKSPGEEGMQDIRLMLAMYEAARTARPVEIDWAYRRAIPV